MSLRVSGAVAPSAPAGKAADRSLPHGVRSVQPTADPNHPDRDDPDAGSFDRLTGCVNGVVSASALAI
jgi:hypothetical protein